MVRGLVLLLILGCVGPSLCVSHQLARLWSFVSRPSSRAVHRGENITVVAGDVSSVIYENYIGTSDSEHILVSSFSNPLPILAIPVQFHLITNVEGSVSFQCQEPGMGMYIVSYITGKSPDAQLNFDNDTAQVHFSMNAPSSSEDGLFGSTRVHINVYATPGQLAARSTVVLNNSNARLVVGEDADTRCNFSAVVSTTQRPAADKCAERSVACEQDCSALTGLCACDHGYVVDTVNPEKCLETHTVTLTITGAEQSLDQFDVSNGDIELLLASQFNQLNGGGVHKVAILENDVNVTTIASRTYSALEHAHRLRRSLMTSPLPRMLVAVDLRNLQTIRVSAPGGVRQRSRRQTCSDLSDVLNETLIFPAGAVDMSTINLPTDFDLSTLCTDPADVVTSVGELTVTIPVPDSLASTLLPDQLQLKNTHLKIVASTAPFSVQSLTASSVWVAGSTAVDITISFDVNTGVALMTGQGNELSIGDVFSVLSPSLTSTAGLDGVAADHVGFEVTFGRETPTEFYFRLLIHSAQQLVGNLIGVSGLPDDGLRHALHAANLDSFNIRNVEFLVTNEGGRISIRVSGNPVLGAFNDVAMTAEITALDVGAADQWVSFAFEINGNISLAAAIKGFIPILDLTGIPGVSELQLPEFSVAFSKPRIGLPLLPTPPDFTAHLPNTRVPSPKLSLPRLQLPGIHYNAEFTLPSLPDLSIGGELGVGDLCMDLQTPAGILTGAVNEGENSAASLTTAIQVLFPSLSISELDIPDVLSGLLDLQAEELCVNRIAKTLTTTINWPSTIELIPSKHGYLSLTNTVIAVSIDASNNPVVFDMSASSSTSFAGLSLQVAIAKDRSGSYLFTATPAQDQITTGDIAGSFGSAELQEALSAVQLSNVVLSGLRIDVFNDPSLTLRFAATVSYSQLPSVTFEIVYSKPFTPDSRFALGISTTSTTLAKVVSSVLPSADISDVPFVSDITVPSVAVLATTSTGASIQGLSFHNADLRRLTFNVSDAKTSLLFPVIFPNIGRKEFVAAFNEINFDFKTPDADTSLLDFAQLALPGVDLSVLSPPAGLPGLQNVFLDRLLVDVAEKRFCVEARLADATFDIIPDVLTMDDIMLNLCMEKVLGETQHNLTVVGNVKLGQISATTTVQQSGSLLEATAVITQEMNIADIVDTLGVSFLPGGDAISGALTQFNSFSLTGTTMKINVLSGASGQGNISITSTAHLTELTADIEILFVGLGTGVKTTVAVFSLPAVELAAIVDMVSGIDIQGLPVLGDLALPAATIAIANKPLHALPTGFKFSNPLVSDAKFAKGAAISYLQGIGDKAKKFTMSLNPDSFDINLEEFPSLQEALAMWLPGADNLDIYKALPNIVPGAFDIQVTRVSYDKSEGKLTVEAAIDDFTVIPSVLDITMATVRAGISKSLPQERKRRSLASQLSLAVAGSVDVFGQTLQLQTVYDQQAKVFALRIVSHSQTGSASVHVAVAFDANAGEAVMTGHANELSVNDIFTVLSPDLASSTGLDGVTANEVGLKVAYSAGKTQFYFRLLIHSAQDLVGSLIGASGLPDDGLKDALQAASLDSFDITNVEFLVTNEGGRLCVKVSGNPALPGFEGVTMLTEVKAFDVGTPDRGVSFAFAIDNSISLAAAIKGFIPILDLTGIPGVSELQLPEFSVAFSKSRIGLPPLPPLPDFTLQLPNTSIPSPKLSLPRLQLPGIHFNADFTLPSLPDLSIGGELGVGDLCMDLQTPAGILTGAVNEGENSAASLTTAIQVLFPSLSISELDIPDEFSGILDLQTEKVCFSKVENSCSITINWPSTIELIPGKHGYLSLENTVVTVGIQVSNGKVNFDLSAASSATLGTIALHVSFNRDSSGQFLFSATPVQELITTGDIAGSFGAEFQQALSDVQLSDVALSGLRIDVFNAPALTLRFAATVSYTDLPFVSFETVVSKPFQSGHLFALGISTTSTTLAKVVSSVLPSADISDVPFVSDITVPSVAVLVTTSIGASIQDLSFLNADLQKLTLNVSDAKISLLFPVTFPAVGRKDFVAAFNDITFDFKTPDADTSLLDFAQLAGVDLSVLSPPAGLPGLQNVFLDRLLVDVAEKQFCVEARLAGTTFSVIPGFLTMDAIAFHLCLGKADGETQHDLAVAGTITIGQVSTEVTVQETDGTLQASATFTDTLDILDITNLLGTTFIPGANVLTDLLKEKGFDSFTLTDTTLVVNRPNGAGDGQTYVSMSSVVELLGLSAEVEILFTGIGTDGNTAVATFSLPTIDLASLVDMVSGIDIQGVPFLGDLSLPGASISIASKPLPALPTGFQFSNPLVADTTFRKGVMLNFLHAIGGKVQNFSMPMSLQSFEINLEALPSLGEAISLIVPGVEGLEIFSALPRLIPGVFGLDMRRLAYNKSEGKLSVEATLGDFGIVPDLLKIKQSVVKAEITKSSSALRKRRTSRYSLSLSIGGTVDLFGLLLNINVYYDQISKAYGMRITSGSGKIEVGELFGLIESVNDLTNPAISALQLSDAVIKNPLFEVSKSGGAVGFRVRGTPVVRGFELFDCEAIAVTQSRQFFLSFNSRKFSIADVIKALTQLDLSKVFFASFLDSPLAIGVTITAKTVRRMSLPFGAYPLNLTTSVEKGLGFTAAFRLPTDCNGNPICIFYRSLGLNDDLLFSVTGIDGSGVTVAFRLPKDLDLGVFKLRNVDIGFRASVRGIPAIGLTNIELNVSVPFPAKGQQPLFFRGSMLIDSVNNIEAEMDMIGIYKQAFGIPFLSFGNVGLGFRYQPACGVPVCVSQLRFQGNIAIGYNCYDGNADECVIRISVFNFDAVDVLNNFFYYATKEVSFRKLLTAVGLPDNPGLLLLDTVQLRDVEVSFSTVARTLPSGVIPGGKDIPAGLVVKGTIEFLFLVNVKVDITVVTVFGLLKSVDALVEVKPMTIGPLQLTSASNTKHGPKFELRASVLPPKFFVSIDGQISIFPLRLTAAVVVEIDHTGLFAQINAPIYGFQAEFKLSAEFVNVARPKSFKNFMIQGCFSSLGDRLVGGVKDALKFASRAIKERLDNAIAGLEAAERQVAKAVDALSIRQNEERAALRGLDAAKAEVAKAEDTIRGLCKISDCSRCQNLPKPCIVQRCHCALPYPCCRRWRCKTCCKTLCIPTPSFCGTYCVPFLDPICLTANAGCEILRASAFVARTVAEAGLEGAKAGVKGAADATALASTVASEAKVLSTVAKGVSDGTLATFSAVSTAITTVLDAFRIKSICFGVNVNAVGAGSICVTIDVLFGGKSFSITETINLSSIGGVAKRLAKRFYNTFF